MRDDVYWHELRRGLAIGYRRGSEGGSWLLREYRGGRYVKRRLAAADDDVPSDGRSVLTWAEAQAQALGGDRPTVTAPARLTIAEAAATYFATRQRGTAHDKLTYDAFIKPALGDTAIAALTTVELRKWLAEQVGDHGDDRDALRAAQATANRRWTLLRAILNRAYQDDPDRVPSADAWRRVKPFANVDRPRLRHLEADEALRLLRQLAPELRELAQGALYTGLRLGELLALRVADVGDAAHVRHSKSGKERHVPLSKDGVKFFAALTANRANDEPVFATLTDTPTFRVKLARAMRAACAAAEIEPAVFHDLRRSYGSLLLNSGASTEQIRIALGHADSRMTQRVYAHLTQQTLAAAIEKHLPTFDVDALPKPARKKKPRSKPRRGE